MNYKLIQLGSLTPTQKADVELSLVWKKQSYILLREALLNHDNVALKNAILWCGQNGHAIRAIGKDKIEKVVEEIKDWVLGHNDFNMVVFDGVAKAYFASKEISSYNWVSKICHILNPLRNPLIFDSATSDFLMAKSIDKWFMAVEAFEKENHEKLFLLPREEAYQVDSIIWVKYS